MSDTLSKAERSALMAKVRGKGNRSTEMRAEAALTEAGIRGWVKHRPDIPGRPDFYFPRLKLALFIDGCFWHACPRCGRLPKSRVAFWKNKIDENRRRDNRIRRQLSRLGYHVMRVWEHDFDDVPWIPRLQHLMRRLRGK